MGDARRLNTSMGLSQHPQDINSLNNVHNWCATTPALGQAWPKSNLRIHEDPIYQSMEGTMHSAGWGLYGSSFLQQLLTKLPPEMMYLS